jgi:3-phenylpropionate/cinnamic acid dioxygenase small subunit
MPLPAHTVPQNLQQLLDRAAVIDLVNRQAMAADARDWAAARACYAPRVRLDYVSLAGGEPSETSADEMIAAWRASLPGFERTQHVISNHQVTLQGDRAVCLSHFRAQHRIADRIWELDGDYRHELARGPQGWLIDGQQMVWTFERGDRALLEEASRRAAQSR